MSWIARLDTCTALTSLSGPSLLHDGALSCVKGQGLSRPGHILIFIFFMSGTGNEEVRQMYRKAAHLPAQVHELNEILSSLRNLKTDSVGNGFGPRFLTPNA